MKEYANINVFYESLVDNIDLKNGTFEVTYKDGTKVIKNEYAMVLGCDGTYSKVLQAFKRTHDFTYSVDYCKYGYFETIAVRNTDGTPDFEPNSLHKWVS
jgi:2-polyprenyl-6-methoxyphenol hydroxylase-like FAD-dependent oxidoreductase